MSVLLPARSHFLRRVLLSRCGAHVGRGTAIGGAVKVYGAFLDIGEHTWVSSESVFYTTKQAPVIVGARCDIGHGAHFVTGSHHIGDARRRAGEGWSRPIRIGDGCWIGARVTILGGATIGNGSVVAAGAVVLPGVYPENVLLAGVPAVVKKEL